MFSVRIFLLPEIEISRWLSVAEVTTHQTLTGTPIALSRHLTLREEQSSTTLRLRSVQRSAQGSVFEVSRWLSGVEVTTYRLLIGTPIVLPRHPFDSAQGSSVEISRWLSVVEVTTYRLLTGIPIVFPGHPFDSAQGSSFASSLTYSARNKSQTQT